MKTHLLAQNLEAMAKLLRSLPNIEVNHILSSIINAVSNGEFKEFSAKTKNTNKSLQNVREGIELELSKLTPDELKSYFCSDVEGKALEKKELSTIATRLGLTTSKTQTRDAIINQLIRHFEATNLDGIIRSRSFTTEDMPLLEQNEPATTKNMDENTPKASDRDSVNHMK